MERFWSKVDKRGPDECWEWQGARKGGRPGSIPYGSFSVGSKRDGSKRQINAHRVAYELANGPIPEGKTVMHTCNNPLCVNPAHLVLGTVKQNIRDAARDGLFSTSKVADEDVIDMAWLVRCGASQSEVARQYGVHHSFVNKVVRGRLKTRLEVA